MSVRNPFDTTQKVCLNRLSNEEESFLKVILFLLVAAPLPLAFDIVTEAVKVLSSLPKKSLLLAIALHSLRFTIAVVFLGIFIRLIGSFVFPSENHHVRLMILTLAIGLPISFTAVGGSFGVAPNLMKKAVSVLSREAKIVLVCDNGNGLVVVDEPYETKLKDGKIFVYLSKKRRVMADIERCSFVGEDSILKRKSLAEFRQSSER